MIALDEWTRVLHVGPHATCPPWGCIHHGGLTAPFPLATEEMLVGDLGHLHTAIRISYQVPMGRDTATHRPHFICSLLAALECWA